MKMRVVGHFTVVAKCNRCGDIEEWRGEYGICGKCGFDGAGPLVNKVYVSFFGQDSTRKVKETPPFSRVVARPVWVRCFAFCGFTKLPGLHFRFPSWEEAENQDAKSVEEVLKSLEGPNSVSMDP